MNTLNSFPPPNIATGAVVMDNNSWWVSVDNEDQFII